MIINHINQKLLDELSAQANTLPRLRQAYDLRNTPEDNSQRMLNALEPRTIMSIHKHLVSSETVALLRGKICWHFYDDAGNETESVMLDANGDVRCINVEKARWHPLECLVEDSVLMKSKDGKYEPQREEEINVTLFSTIYTIWE